MILQIEHMAGAREGGREGGEDKPGENMPLQCAIWNNPLHSIYI